MTKTEFDRMLEDARMDEGAKKAFLAMSREEQLLAILGMQSYIRSELVIVKKDQIEFGQDLQSFKTELRQVRRAREVKEKARDDGDEVNTTQKIIKTFAEEMSKRFDLFVWFRDKVLPTVVTIITLALLYFVFGGKIPTP